MDKIEHVKLTEAVRERYHESTKSQKSKILDEFVAITGFHRKYALRVLRRGDVTQKIKSTAHKKIYDKAVKEAIVVLWGASGGFAASDSNQSSRYCLSLWRVIKDYRWILRCS